MNFESNLNFVFLNFVLPAWFGHWLVVEHFCALGCFVVAPAMEGAKYLQPSVSEVSLIVFPTQLLLGFYLRKIIPA